MDIEVWDAPAATVLARHSKVTFKGATGAFASGDRFDAADTTFG